MSIGGPCSSKQLPIKSCITDNYDTFNCHQGLVRPVSSSPYHDEMLTGPTLCWSCAMITVAVSSWRQLLGQIQTASCCSCLLSISSSYILPIPSSKIFLESYTGCYGIPVSGWTGDSHIFPIILARYESLHWCCTLQKEAFLVMAGTALICRHKHEYSEISSIPYPLSQTILTTCDLSSHGLLTRFTVGGLSFLSWTSFSPVRKQPVIPMAIMSPAHRKALHRAGHYSRPEGSKPGWQLRTFLPR